MLRSGYRGSASQSGPQCPGTHVWWQVKRGALEVALRALQEPHPRIEFGHFSQRVLETLHGTVSLAANPPEAQRTSLRLAHVSRARISQILNLLVLALDIQEALLFLPRTECGHDPIHLRQLQPLAALLDWGRQRVLWHTLQ